MARISAGTGMPTHARQLAVRKAITARYIVAGMLRGIAARKTLSSAGTLPPRMANISGSTAAKKSGAIQPTIIIARPAKNIGVCPESLLTCLLHHRYYRAARSVLGLVCSGNAGCENRSDLDEGLLGLLPVLSENSSVPQSALKAVSRAVDIRRRDQEIGDCPYFTGWKRSRQAQGRPVLPRRPRLQAEACGSRKGKSPRGWTQMRGGCAAYTGWKPVPPKRPAGIRLGRMPALQNGNGIGGRYARLRRARLLPYTLSCATRSL